MTEGLDWSRIGRNVRQARIIRGYSQEEFARRAGLSITTLYHVEQGNSVSRRSLLKICESLEESLDSIRTRNRIVLSPEDDYQLYRHELGIWTVELETRRKVPEDNLRRIQDPQERLRLGRLGLVPVFFCTTSFLMPEGPGLAFIELFGKFEDAFNSIIYRDCLFSCTQGSVRLKIGESVLVLNQGDVVGYHSKDLRWVEPAEPVGIDGFPVCLTWTGAVRVGTRPDDGTGNDRVRRKRRTKE